MEGTLEARGYVLKATIGEGGFSKVYLVTSKKYQTEFVAKVISINNRASSNLSNVDSYLNEISSLKVLDNKNIINLYDYFKDEEYLYIIMEYCPNGNLKEYIMKEGPLSKDMFLILSKQILEALEMIHSCGICHRDIKPENIFFDQYYRPKIGDFGLADNANKESKTYMGTLCYLAPEIIKKEPYDGKKSDIWALGVTFYVMLTGSFPFMARSKAELFQQIKRDRVMLPGSFDSDLKFLIYAMTSVDPENRKTASELLKLPIYQEEEALMPLNKKSSMPLTPFKTGINMCGSVLNLLTKTSSKPNTHPINISRSGSRYKLQSISFEGMPVPKLHSFY